MNEMNIETKTHDMPEIPAPIAVAESADAPAASAPPSADPVEAALAAALEKATAAGEWSVVAQLAKELESRRTGRAGSVVSAAPAPSAPAPVRGPIVDINVNLSREPEEDSIMVRLPNDPKNGHTLQRMCFSFLGGIIFESPRWYEIPASATELLAALKRTNNDGTLTEKPKKNCERAFEFVPVKGGEFVRHVREEFNRAERVAMGITREGAIDREVLVHGVPRPDRDRLPTARGA